MVGLVTEDQPEPLYLKITPLSPTAQPSDDESIWIERIVAEAGSATVVQLTPSHFNTEGPEIEPAAHTSFEETASIV